MAKKTHGKNLGKKGLMAALARHVVLEKSQLQLAKKEALQKEHLAQKQQSMKGGGKVNKNKKKQQLNLQKSGYIPFKKGDRVLLVGEGDFSFAKSIIAQQYIEPENLIATSYDSYDELVAKYPNVEDTVKLLIESGVKVIHEVDALNMVASLKLTPTPKLKKAKVELFADHANLDYIMFNFPHTGRGMKDVDRNIRDHQQLVLGYFKSCNQVFDIVNNQIKDDFAGYSASDDSTNVGKVILSLFDGEPYSSWGVKILGRSEGFRVDRSAKFDWPLYPEYHHRRTNSTRDTTKPAAERDARIYIFEKFDKKEADEKERRRRNDEDSDDN